MNPRTNPGIRIIAFLMILPCLYACWLALAWGIADRHASLAEKRLNNWAAGEQIDYEELSWAIGETQTALEWAPNNPGYHDLIARLLLIRLIREQDMASGEAAKAHLLQSRQIRPEWPHNWALYIDVKHNMSEADEELSEAIIAATRYGRWDPSVHQSVTEAGVAHYKDLSEEAKKAIVGNVKRAFNSAVPGVVGHVTKLIANQKDNLSLGFVYEIVAYLVVEPWSVRAQPHLAELTLLWWPYLNSEQRLTAGIQIAGALAASQGYRLIRTVEKTGRLPEICPRLPREMRFVRACNRAFRIAK